MPNASAAQATHNAVSPENLALYEAQKPFVEPLLRWCRLWNTALDGLFYDVGLLSVALLARGDVVDVAASLRNARPYRAIQPERFHYRGGRQSRAVSPFST